MPSPRAIRNVVGIIGNVISFGLFLSPVPTFWRIYKKKDVEEFQPYPYVATVLNCMLWVFYGLPIVTPDSTLVVTINGFGLAIELLYLSLFSFYDSKGKGRKRVAIGLLAEVLFMAVIITTTMLAFHKHKQRTFFVGIFCDIFNIIMYSSPLGIMKKVITTKSVEYMPLYLSLANFLNGCCWTAYALIYKIDYFILVSNGLGALAGAVQLILYACYYNTTPKKPPTTRTDVEKAPEIQLPGSTAPPTI